MYISCQTHDGSLHRFFAHENQACPPSLSNMGKLQLETTSNIVSCLEKLVPTPTPTKYSIPDIQPCLSLDVTDMPAVDVVILDGAALVNMQTPGTARTFSDYASLTTLGNCCISFWRGAIILHITVLYL